MSDKRRDGGGPRRDDKDLEKSRGRDERRGERFQDQRNSTEISRSVSPRRSDPKPKGDDDGG